MELPCSTNTRASFTSSFLFPLCRARYNALPADIKAAANANAAPLNTDAADFQPSTDVNVLQQQARMVRRRRNDTG